MNLKKLFEVQKVLDKRIIEEKGLSYTKTPAWKRVALLTEIGELANEWRGFKKWSENQKPNTHAHKPHYIDVPVDPNNPDGPIYRNDIGRTWNPMLEEYVDGLGFILSIGIDLGCEDYSPTFSSIGVAFGDDDELTIQFEEVYRYAASFKTFPVNDKRTWYSFLFSNYLGLGKMLGFEWEQIEEAFFEKKK